MMSVLECRLLAVTLHAMAKAKAFAKRYSHIHNILNHLTIIVNIWAILGSQIQLAAEQAAAGVFVIIIINDVPHFRKACFGKKLTIFIVILTMFANICQYLSMYGITYIPTYYTVLRI